MSVEKALKEFPEKAGIARYSEPEDRRPKASTRSPVSLNQSL